MASAANDQGTASDALRRMADAEPDLAARLVLHSLPAAAANLPSGLSYRLEIEDLGAWRITANGGGPASVTVVNGDGSGGSDGYADAPAESDGDAFAISTDAPTLARLAAGRSPLGAMLRGRLKLRGKRRKALALRRLSSDAGPRELAKLGAPVDPDLIYRSLAYAIDPEWTRGHSFRVGYEVVGEGGGRWHVEVRDGVVSAGRGFGEGEPDGIVRISIDTWTTLLRGDITPAAAMQLNLTEFEGDVYAITLLGRWIDRADGRDGPELDREARQRRIQAARAGAWGSKPARNGASSDAGDPGETRPTGGLMSYEQLYALWERQNWRSHELDFSLDREHWLATPGEAQAHTAFSFGSFYVGEERVTADLAPFLLAAPNGEVEAFLATQLVDEMRHAVFFDRWMAEVMGLEGNDMRARLEEIESKMLGRAWHFLFDDSLRHVANRIKAKPDDLELFVEGIVTYHMVTEGVLAMPGQRIIIQYTEDHSVYPGFNKGFRLVEQDEHRHIAFGVRFLKDVCEERPEMKSVVLNTLEKLLPEAAKVFVPLEADDPTDFTSYGHHSSQVYGFAYNALKRRMAMIGIEIPGPERLMPGPVDPAGSLEERHPLREQAATVA